MLNAMGIDGYPGAGWMERPPWGGGMHHWQQPTVMYVTLACDKAPRFDDARINSTNVKRFVLRLDVFIQPVQTLLQEISDALREARIWCQTSGYVRCAVLTSVLSVLPRRGIAVCYFEVEAIAGLQRDDEDPDATAFVT